MHNVAVLAVHGVVALDLTIPCEIFGHIRLSDPADEYRVHVCGETPEVQTLCFSLRVPWRLDTLAQAHTVVVPGVEDPRLPVPDSIVEALRQAWANGARIVSICTGAFVLAAAGLLDGRRAATHWAYAGLLARRYPKVTVDPNVLFVDEGRIVTSAGVAAGFDLCLHLVRRDHGQAIAMRAAQMAVMPLDRPGGQAQFIRHEPPTSTSSLAPLLEWMQANLHQRLPNAVLAERVASSPRTLNRRFLEQTGTTPVQWLLQARVRRAQELLETTRLSIDEIAAAVGFEDAAALRERFRRSVGVSPSSYRKNFAAEGAAGRR